MRVHFVGHATFLLTTARGVRVMVDPCRHGALGGRLRTARLRSAPDVVAVTHFHEDHGWIGEVPGAPVVVDRSATVAGVRFRAITAPHDAAGGARMGLTRSFVLREADGLRVLHVGDLGDFDASWCRAVGRVDLALVPVGGVFTLSPARALALGPAVGARWIVPMHYRTADVVLDIADREPFLDAARAAGVPIHAAANPVRFGPDTAPGVTLLEPPPADAWLTFDGTEP